MNDDPIEPIIESEVEYIGPEARDPQECPWCHQWKHKCTCPPVSQFALQLMDEALQRMTVRKQEMDARYLKERLEEISFDLNEFAQAAIAWAAKTRLVELGFLSVEEDRRRTMERYDEICEGYQKQLKEQNI
jgi:hypothetical protein